MKLTRLLVALAALVSLSVMAPAASSATTVDECQAQLATLRADTASTGFTNVKSRESLVAKVDAASRELALGKTADAVGKLVDFQTTLSALATAQKPKLDPTEAELLVAQGQGAIDCIGAIGT
jgi:hypothetical protein